MQDSLPIQLLPDWRFAGKPAEGLLHHSVRHEDGYEIRSYVSSTPATDEDLHLREYKVVNGYLLPHYPPEDPSRQRRNLEKLDERARDFWAATGLKGIRRTSAEITREIEQFDAQMAVINKERELDGKPAVSLSTPYRSMTQDERALVARGANFVAHAADRLHRLGHVLLQGNREGVTIEYDDAYVRDHMQDIALEFRKLYGMLIDNKHESLVRCVLTREGRTDHDAALHHMLRELGKPVLESLWMGNATEETGAQLEHDYRTNMIEETGKCLGAIDEANRLMHVMTHHPMFRNFMVRAERVRAGDHPPAPEIREVSLFDYRGLLSEYVELCRASACLREEDTDNYNPVANRLRFLKTELGLHHAVMFRCAEAMYERSPTLRQTSDETITLLKRGVNMMGEMADLSLPRDKNANGVYDQSLKEFKGRDASTVGRFAENVMALKNGKLQGSSGLGF